MKPHLGERHECLLVRHTPQHAVVAHVSGLPGGKLRLLKLTHCDGVIPDAESLLDNYYTNRRTLRQAVVQLLRQGLVQHNDIGV